MNSAYKRYWEPSTAQALGLGLSVNSLATFLTYPIEFAKTRCQVKGEGIGIRQNNQNGGYNFFKVIRDVHAQGRGFQGLYEGFSSHFLSRIGYIFIRNILYKSLYDEFKPVKASNDLTTREKAVIAAFAGGVAAFCTNPFELINTRIVCDGGIYKPHRRNYKGFSDAYTQIVATEGGAKALFKGGLANVFRAVLLNVTLTGPYDYLKEKLNITFGDIECNRGIALLWASFWATTVVLPFDNVKTRLMKQFPNTAFNRVSYQGWVDCVGKVIQNEGPLGFLPGFYALYTKIFLYSVITVYASDVVTTSWKRDAGLKEWQI